MYTVNFISHAARALVDGRLLVPTAAKACSLFKGGQQHPGILALWKQGLRMRAGE